MWLQGHMDLGWGEDSEHIVHQDVVDMTLTDQFPNENLGHLFSLFDIL